MPDAKRPDPKRRSPAPRPGKAVESGRGRPRTGSPARREPRAIAPRPKVEAAEQTEEEVAPEPVLEPIKRAIAEAAERQSEQRFGSAARRAAILAAVVCVLTLTIAGPVRTYFAQAAEVKHNAEIEGQLRSQIADLEQQKLKLKDPVYIASQARERLGFVMPGDIPYQVQLPASAMPNAAPGASDAAPVANGQPWYTSLWKTIADAPHGISPVAPLPPAGAPPDAPPPPDVPPGVPPPAPPPGG
jgi:cell division protein FtsB